jgi:hypothetical protein
MKLFQITGFDIAENNNIPYEVVCIVNSLQKLPLKLTKLPVF